MASIKFELEASIRSDVGKGASRRLRRCEDRIPAILYGAGKPAVAVTLAHNKMAKALQQEAFYSHILNLKFDDATIEQVILKAVQRHPFKAKILHLDFQRIKSDEKLSMQVPLHFENADKCPGVKAGGIISHQVTTVEVSCLPINLPEFISVDLSNLELNQVLHLSELTLPEGVELTSLTHHDNDSAVITVYTPRESVEKEDETPTATPSEVPTVKATEDKKGS